MQPVLSFLVSGLVFALLAYGMIRLSMFLTLRSGRSAQQQIDTTLARVSTASATVLQVGQPSGMMRKPRLGSSHVLLTLDIHPASGPSYQASTLWQVDLTALAQLQPGQTIPVRIDADTPATIYPNVGWASYTWS